MKKQTIPTLVEEKASLPVYESEKAAGADVRAHTKKDVIIQPGERKFIPMGLRFAIPRGFEIQVRPRSGLALKYGITFSIHREQLTLTTAVN